CAPAERIWIQIFGVCVAAPARQPQSLALKRRDSDEARYEYDYDERRNNDRRDATLVGHSTGGGEVARYIGRHGTERVAKAVLIGSITPLILRTPANPGVLPMEAFDKIRAGVLADRSQFFMDLSVPFYG